MILFIQGIIAPKIEISTKTVIEEVKTIYHANIDQSCVFNPKTIDSKVKYIRNDKYYYSLYFYYLMRQSSTNRFNKHDFSKNLTPIKNELSKVLSGKEKFVIVEQNRKIKFVTRKYYQLFIIIIIIMYNIY